FQVAAHEEIVPLAELYRACEVARAMLVDEHAVSRVIARPFTGTPGAYRRTANRKDFSLEPVGATLLDRLAAAGGPRGGSGHGDDPTTPSTDHSREAVPILALGPRVRPQRLGERRSFADLGATVAEYFGLEPLAAGTSFLREIAA